MARPKPFHARIWMRYWWGWKRHLWIGCCALLLTAATFHFGGKDRLWSRVRCGTQMRQPCNNPFQGLYRGNPLQQCQETVYQPFVVGCPESCSRADVSPDEPLYRLTMEWYLGQPPNLRNGNEQTTPITKEGQYYDIGYNYQSCSSTFATDFGRAADRLEATLASQFPNLQFTQQARMHLSLAYLCCLRLEEAHHVREIMRTFVKEQQVFRIPAVTFERIECWKERYNSVTNIIVVDNASQQRLLAVLKHLEARIQRAGIDIAVQRVTQMPFHVTLLGARLGDVPYSRQPAHAIDGALNATAAAVQSLSWPGHCFDIAHDPKFSYRPKHHTHLT